jgi:hypothetical protein
LSEIHFAPALARIKAQAGLDKRQGWVAARAEMKRSSSPASSLFLHSLDANTNPAGSSLHVRNPDPKELSS